MNLKTVKNIARLIDLHRKHKQVRDFFETLCNIAIKKTICNCQDVCSAVRIQCPQQRVISQ